MAADGSSAGGAAPAGGAAFFDLDKTLMEGSSAFQFARAAYRGGLLSRRRLVADAWANTRFRLRGATDEDSFALRQRIATGLSGRRVLDLQRLGPGVLAGVLPRVYPRMLAVAHAHQDAGRRAYITTAASLELATILAQVLSFDGAIGSDLSEVVDGVYTGRVSGLFAYHVGKAEAIRELAAREGIDLEQSYAYTDSVSDLPMLEAVGHPVAVNPDRALAAIARERGWELMRLDRLGRRVKTGIVLAGAAAAGGVASTALAGRRG
jgi:HAD superfamily hydrolase (TIGR01490 family)